LDTLGSIPVQEYADFLPAKQKEFSGIGRMELNWQDSCPTFSTSENKDQEVDSMKSPKIFAAIATVLLVSVCLTAAPLQQAPGGGAAQAKTATGELSKVDVDKKEITIKGSDNKEMVFTWNDATQITGIEDGAQGLTGKPGATLKVTYQEKDGANLASRIEVQEKK
jgi:Cu/Ag efflux protein CusF